MITSISGIFCNTRSLNARFARRIMDQSNFTCPFQIDQLKSLEVTISSPSPFLYRIQMSSMHKTAAIKHMSYSCVHLTFMFNELGKKALF